MKRYYLKQLFTTFLLLCSIVANAHDFEVDGIYYNFLSGCEVEVTYEGDEPVGEETDYFQYRGYISISEIVEFEGVEYYITKIGEDAFSRCYNLIEINLPNSVVTIGNNAFAYCEKLSNIYYWGTINNIGESAFSGCESLTEESFDNIVSENTELENGAFMGCDGLETLNLKVYKINNGCFANCENLKEVYISTNEIGLNPFWGCNKLEIIQVSANCNKYDSRNNCNAIIETSSNKLITGCKTTTIPNDIKIIGTNSFALIKIKSIDIPKSVKCIEWQALLDCDIETIFIPENVKEIGTFAFESDVLTSLICESKVPPLLIGDPHSSSIEPVYSNFTLYVPYGAKEAYTATAGWNKCKNIVEIRNTYTALFLIDGELFATKVK